MHSFLLCRWHESSTSARALVHSPGDSVAASLDGVQHRDAVYHGSERNGLLVCLSQLFNATRAPLLCRTLEKALPKGVTAKQ